MHDGAKYNFWRIFAKIATVAVAAAVAISAVFIMIRHLGLNDRLDFGAGAYYYADIPEFQTYVDPALEAGGTATPFPFWLAALLFLIWGALMYLLWVRIDKSGKN